MIYPHFDLNDIDHEPTDAQLAALMNAVAAEARRRAAAAREEMMRRLQAELREAMSAAYDNSVENASARLLFRTVNGSPALTTSPAHVNLHKQEPRHAPGRDETV
jgi:hypothetical protein